MLPMPPPVPGVLAAKDTFTHPVLASVSPSLRGPLVGRGKDQGMVGVGRFSRTLPSVLLVSVSGSGGKLGVQTWPGTPPSSSWHPTGITTEPGIAWRVSENPRGGLQ